MYPSAIYSKSGKGVQEAGGKTSHLSRPDRAILSAIDGRATLADVASKVGKQFDPAFEKVIESLDKGGFIREVSPGVAPPAPKPAAGGKPGAKPAGKATAPMDAASDLDFTSFSTPSTGKPLPPPQAPPRAAPPPPKATNIPPPPPPPTAAEKAKAERTAVEQQDVMAKAREEAERKAAAERERVKAEAEARMRAESETKMRAEADLKAKEAEAKVKAAQEAAARATAEAKAKAEADSRAAAEAKARAEAEAKKAREEAERARREAEEKAERARKEAEEKAERARKEAEAEAKRAREEAERARKAAEAEAKKAREEAERARREADEKAERARKEAEEKAERARKEAEEKARREQEELKRKLEEERQKLEAERRQREEERKKEEAEREARKRRDEEERAQRRIQEERERVERRRQEKEEEEEADKRAARRRARDDDEVEEEKPKPKPKPEPAKPAASGGFSDSLMADLESFTNREETEAKEKEEAERKAKEEAAKRAREAEERRLKEEAERREREEKERKKEEAAARKRAEEQELKDKQEREKRRVKEEEEKRKKEAEEREKKAKQEESLAARATSGGAPRGEAGMGEEERLRRRRERQLGPAPHSAAKERARGGWGKPIAITLFLLLVVGVGVAHIMPIDVTEYRQAAEEALGQPVKIGSARLSLISGLQLKFNDVVVGETRIAEVRAFPELDALTGPRKRFSRIEIDGLKLDQQVFGAALFARSKGTNFNVARVVVKQLQLVGPLSFPKGGLEIDALLDHEGVVRAATVRGPDALLVKLGAKENEMDVDLSAANFSMPFAPEITLSKFSLKGTATPRGMSVSEWDGQALNGNMSGTANLRWGDNWAVDGVITARNIYAAVFAPALLSEGKGEGSGKFSMRGEPGKLGTRLDGSFSVANGTLGSIDLSRAIQSGGKSATGRTPFKEMNGQGVYDRGAVALRNVTINAGQLNAGASVDISQGGNLSGRVVADVRVSSQVLRATLNLGGTLKEPQVRN